MTSPVFAAKSRYGNENHNEKIGKKWLKIEIFYEIKYLYYIN